jgi:hypothetical protein
VAENPLKKYFRQPKIYIDLPSKGAYNRPGTIMGDAVQMPVYGMTGMDEIISKTPDALLSGESTVRIVESCIPSITDAKDLCALDIEFVMTAIRIATHGNVMEIRHTCSQCNEVNDFEIDLGSIINRYKDLEFQNRVPGKELTIRLKPLTFAEFTAFQLRNFNIQRTLFQLSSVENPEENIEKIDDLLKDLGHLQTDVIVAQIDAVEITEGLVDQKDYIDEWLKNVDRNTFETIRKQIEENRKNWALPNIPVKCDSCGHDEETSLQMEQSSFFDKA